MNARTLLLAVAALATAATTAFLVQQWIERQRAAYLARGPVEAPRQVGKRVLVAKRALAVGTFVKAEHLRWRPWPADGLEASYVVEGKRELASFVGAVVRRGILAGEPVTDRRVVKPGERGFLAAVLTPGMRAVSVAINPTSGISGLVFPGDRVDLILAHKFEPAGAKTRRLERASETVLTDVRVLAVGQTTDDQNGKPIVAKTATLEVTPKQAEKVTLAVELGRLSLSLRSLARAGADGTPRRRARRTTYTRDSDVSRLIGRTGVDVVHTVNVVRGGKSETAELRGTVR